MVCTGHEGKHTATCSRLKCSVLRFSSSKNILPAKAVSNLALKKCLSCKACVC